jgi:PAS domain S-box-containing protein
MSSIHSRLSRRMANPDSPFDTAILACVLAFLCFLATKLGWALMIRPQMLWPVWPGCALLVAVLLMVPRRIWPILIAAGLAGFVLYDLQVRLPFRPTLLLVLADIAEILIAALGGSYSFDGLPRLNSIKSLVRYSFFSVMLAPLAAASISSIAFGENYWIRWRIGFFTEALALLTLTPAILSWVNAAQTRMFKSRAFYFEGVALISGLSIFGYVAFVAPGHIAPALAIYSLLPFLLWAALRFGSVGITTSMVLVAFLSIWGAVHGRGPFTGSEPLTNVMSLQLVLFFAATTFMVLAVLIEERKQSGHALRESEERFRLLADTAPALIWMSGTDKLYTYFNKPWLDFTGRSIDLELGTGWAEGVHPEDLERCLNTYAQAFDRREEFRMEYRLRRHDGEYRWVLDIGVPRVDQDGSFVGYIGIAIDVTERKHTEQALEKSEEKFSKAFRQSPLGLALTNIKDDRYIDVNETFERVSGWSREEIIGRTPFDIGIWVDPAERMDLTRRLLTDGYLGNVEVRFRTKDGSIRIGLLTAEGIELNGEPCMITVGADITDRKLAEEALRESEERFRLAARAGKMFAYEWDALTDVIVRSAESGHILGIDDGSQVTGQQVSAAVHPDDRERLVAAIAALSPEKPHLQVRYRMVRPDGKVIWLERTSRADFDEGGKILRIVGMAADVTDRKMEELELAQANDRLRLAMESGKSVGWEWDLRTGQDSWFGDLKSMFGVPSESFVGKTEDFFHYVHAEDRAAVAKAVAEARESRNPYAAQFRVVWPDGTVRWVSAKGKFHYSPEGEPERMLGMAVDITEQRHTEASLRLFRKLIDESSDAIEVVDPDTLRFLDVNERACRDLGYTRDEMLSLGVYDIDPFLDESSAQKCQKELDDKGFRRFDAIHRRKDGSTYPVEVNLKRVQLDRVYSVNVVRDITERRRSDEALRQKDAELTEAQRIAEVGSWQWDPETDTGVWSQELYRIADRDPNLPMVSFAEHSSLYTPESWKRLREVVEEAMRSGAPYQLDLEMIRSDGATRWIKVRGEAQRDAAGRVVGLRGTAQDISERKRAEALRDGESRILEMIARDAPLREILEKLVRVVEGQFSGLLCSVLLLDEDGQHVHHGAAPSLPEGYAKAIDGLPIGPKAGSCGTAMYRREPVVVTDILQDPLWEEYRGVAEPYGLRACWSTPILSHSGEALGSFAMYYPEPRGPSSTETRTLEMASHLAGIAIEGKLIHEQLRRSEAYLAEGQRLSQTGSWAFDARDAVYWSEETHKIFEYDRAVKPTLELVFRRVHPEDADLVRQTIQRALQDRKDFEHEYRLLMPGGSIKHVHVVARALSDESGRVEFVGALRDVTAAKRAEQTLRESEAYLAEAQRLSHTGSGAWRVPEGDALYLSDEWYRIYGFDPKEGLPAWKDRLQRMHPEDRAKVEETKDRAIREKSDYAVDHRILLPDGTVKYAHTVGHAVLNASGEVEQFVYTMMDVTERKRAEEALSGMSRKLIEAQEQERARIARELHDDLGQRLALLANEMEQLQQSYPDLRDEVSSSIRELQNHAFQIAADVQSLSHTLHSSKLEYLGIAAAMRGFCQEFGRQQKAEIDFKSHDVPSPLPPEISLCLFRVLQEALHNAIKHSGVRYVEVGLWGTSDEIHLTVSDSGAGFDSEMLKESRGLGLVSMEERLKLVKGTFSIESQPKRGTTIHASVPLRSGADIMRAVG